MNAQSRIFALTLAVTILTQAYLSAQDDSYENVRFVNEGAESVKIKVWNTREGREPYVWKVDAGKSLDFVDETGKRLRIGVYSSMIKVNDTSEKSVISVSARQEGGVRVITWTGKDFKPSAKPSE